MKLVKTAAPIDLIPNTQAPAGLNLKRGLVAAIAAFTSFRPVGANKFELQFGSSPVGGALTLPTHMAPAISACLTSEPCVNAVYARAPAIMWRQSMQAKDAEMFGAHSPASESLALSTTMRWEIARHHGMTGYPDGLPVINSTIFGTALTFAKTPEDPLGCKTFHRATDVA